MSQSDEPSKLDPHEDFGNQVSMTLTMTTLRLVTSLAYVLTEIGIATASESI